MAIRGRDRADGAYRTLVIRNGSSRSLHQTRTIPRMQLYSVSRLFISDVKFSLLLVMLSALTHDLQACTGTRKKSWIGEPSCMVKHYVN